MLVRSVFQRRHRFAQPARSPSGRTAMLAASAHRILHLQSSSMARRRRRGAPNSAWLASSNQARQQRVARAVAPSCAGTGVCVSAGSSDQRSAPARPWTISAHARASAVPNSVSRLCRTVDQRGQGGGGRAGCTHAGDVGGVRSRRMTCGPAPLIMGEKQHRAACAVQAGVVPRHMLQTTTPTHHRP